jgi:hypothetical protein
LAPIECEWPESAQRFRLERWVDLGFIVEITPNDAVALTLNYRRHSPAREVPTLGADIESSPVSWEVSLALEEQDAERFLTVRVWSPPDAGNEILNPSHDGAQGHTVDNQIGVSPLGSRGPSAEVLGWALGGLKRQCIHMVARAV